MPTPAFDGSTRPALQVRVDLGRCTGRGDCADIAPTVFVLDRYGYPVVAPFDQDDAEVRIRIREARARCPEGAIHVEEVDRISTTD